MTTTTRTTLTETQERLSQLEDDYQQWVQQERELNSVLESLKDEESCLKRALQEAATTVSVPVVGTDDPAVQRLQQALLDDSSSSSSNEDET